MLSTDEKRRQFEAANFFKLGYSYVKRDFLEKAEVAFQKAVKLAPNHAQSWAYLSKIYEKWGKHDEAKECHKKASKLDKSIDFKLIADECRLLEDRQSITTVMLRYQDGKMTTTEFIAYVEGLSARSLALISNDTTSRIFFSSAIENAVMERVLAFEFEGLSSLLSSLTFTYSKIVHALEMNLIPMFLTIDDIEKFNEFVNFLHSKLADSKEAKKLQTRAKLWRSLAKEFQDTAKATSNAFERAIELFNIIETRKKHETETILTTPLLNEIVAFIITTTAEEGKKGTQRLLKAFKVPIHRVVEILESNIVIAFLSSKSRKHVIDLVTSLQKEMIEKKKAKKHITRVANWLRILNLLKEAFEKSINEHDRIVNLLDVIVETNAEFQPMTIAEQSLRMIERDLVQIERRGYESYLQSRVLHWDLFERRHVDKKTVRRWLSAVKRAYFKLHLMSKNSSLKLSEEERAKIREIAEKMLKFMIVSRKEDLIERMTLSGMRRFNVIDVFLPEEYLAFSVPAFRVMNDFLKDPYSVAAEIEFKNPRIRFNVEFWSLSLAVTLTVLPPFLFSDNQYIDFIVPEYLKTLALAMKKNLGSLSCFHRLASLNIYPQDIMISIFKGLSDHSATQLTREQVLEALEYG
ncbi:MAG: tetratricopeptide repeat protein, partial [Candidatus Thorarchaeota archaeon]